MQVLHNKVLILIFSQMSIPWSSVKLKRSNSTAKKLGLFASCFCQRSLQNRTVMANICIKKFVCVRPRTDLLPKSSIHIEQLMVACGKIYSFAFIIYLQNVGIAKKDVPLNFNSIQIKSKNSN